jgi:hypothetical protein
MAIRDRTVFRDVRADGVLHHSESSFS